MPSGNPTTFKNLYSTNVASMPKTWQTITYPYGVAGASLSQANPTTANFNDGYTFLSADGIAVNLFYNPYCVYTSAEKSYTFTTYSYTNIVPQLSLDTACMSGVYDMNGLKKPNQVGKDIGFFGVFYNGSQSASVATLPYKDGFNSGYNWTAAYNYCSGLKGYKLPTVAELGALYLGSKITGLPTGVWLWSTSWVPGSTTYVQAVTFAAGRRDWDHFSYSGGAVRCVRD